MILNRVHTNDITQFSDLNEVVVAITGKYLKMKDRTFCITIRGVTCFIHTWGDSKIEIPNHYRFKFTDDNGEHLVEEEITNIEVKGVSNFFFTINDSNK